MEKPSYYSIIPASVRYDKNLKANEKLLYGELTALSNTNGYCHAKNEYFANLYGVSTRAIRTWISNLEYNGYIYIESEKQNNQVVSRKIYISDEATKKHIESENKKTIKEQGMEENFHPLEENFQHPRKKTSNTPGRKLPTPPEENFQHPIPANQELNRDTEEKTRSNITSINNTSNNNTSIYYSYDNKNTKNQSEKEKSDIDLEELKNTFEEKFNTTANEPDINYMKKCLDKFELSYIQDIINSIQKRDNANIYSFAYILKACEINASKKKKRRSMMRRDCKHYKDDPISKFLEEKLIEDMEKAKANEGLD